LGQKASIGKFIINFDLDVQAVKHQNFDNPQKSEPSKLSPRYQDGTFSDFFTNYKISAAKKERQKM